jgi:hypothetical protein
MTVVRMSARSSHYLNITGSRPVGLIYLGPLRSRIISRGAAVLVDQTAKDLSPLRSLSGIAPMSVSVTGARCSKD